MRHLLDTHCFIWFIDGDPRLSPRARDAINDPDHAIDVATMPHHYRDPFDRLLVAQALIDNLPLIGRDPAFDTYGVQRVW